MSSGKQHFLKTPAIVVWSHDKMWADLGKSNICIFHQNWDFAIFSIYNVRITSLLSMSIYNSTISELYYIVLCNAAIIITNIDVCKFACAHNYTQNRT